MTVEILILSLSLPFGLLCIQVNDVALMGLWKVEGDMGAGARENMGREKYGRREKKGKKEREAGSQRGREEGEKFKKESVFFYYFFFMAYDPIKNMKPLTFFDFHLTPPRLKTKFYVRENENSSSG